MVVVWYGGWTTGIADLIPSLDSGRLAADDAALETSWCVGGAGKPTQMLRIRISHIRC